MPNVRKLMRILANGAITFSFVKTNVENRLNGGITVADVRAGSRSKETQQTIPITEASGPMKAEFTGYWQHVEFGDVSIV